MVSTRGRPSAFFKTYRFRVFVGGLKPARRAALYFDGPSIKGELFISKVESLPGDKLKLSRAWRANPSESTLLEDIGAERTISIWQGFGSDDGGEESPYLGFEVEFDRVDWLPINLDATLDDVAQEAVLLHSVHYEERRG